MYECELYVSVNMNATESCDAFCEFFPPPPNLLSPCGWLIGILIEGFREEVAEVLTPP